ncbi:MAG: Rpn family recombination-promoting nuclease/putative transposase [Chloroflexi bacterium]|nr:Rpn family recombination-promoting nuclease/putative transposase [Chloroflexota bacterium]
MQERGGPRRFDVASRTLIDSDPAGWLTWVGLPVDGPVSTIESDVSTVLAVVDKVLRVDGPTPWLAHLEVQASRDRFLPVRLLQYHALLLHRHDVPVATTVVLLRPEANAPELTGTFEQRGPSGDPTILFRYGVVRLWERPVDELLAGSLNVAPLAPLAAFHPDRLADVLDRLDERFSRESPSPSLTDELWAATLLMMGVRYTEEQIRGLSERVQRMRESVTYQMIVNEGIERGIEQGIERGEVRGARRILLGLGTHKFGPPDPETSEALERIEDVAALEQLAEGVLDASSWPELLARSSQ